MGLINSKKEVLEKEACVDYAFHCCITDLNGGEILDEMETAVKEGITSFKCFFVYKKEHMMVDDATFVRLLLRAKELGAKINLHAENPDLIDMRTEQFLKEGKTSAWYHYLSRPEFVEAEADKRAVHWATHLDAPLYIVHMADKEGLEECIKAKTEGHELYIETCPQYLEFTCDVYKREDGRNFVCSPPMKGKESQDALWTAIKSGMIDTVATDHCPFQSYEKTGARMILQRFQTAVRVSKISILICSMRQTAARFLLKERLSFAQQTQQKSSVAMTRAQLKSVRMPTS